MSGGVKDSSRWLSLAALLSLAACDPHYIDAIARGDEADPCLALAANQCAADTEHGCSLQPNPRGCTSNDPSCGAGTCRGGDPFVRRSGEALFLHGAPFTFVGTVSWQLAWNEACHVGSYASQADALGPIFDELARMQLSVLRVWAFQSYAGASGTDYSHFDRLVARARSSGIRLIPVLENAHPDCSSGNAKDDTWFGTGYQQPYGDYALSYRDYVSGLVTHFRNEPTILAWQLMHEAGGEQFGTLDGFAEDMTRVVRSNAPNHLLALGLDGGNTPATSTTGTASNYFLLQNRPEIDLVDIHDFDDSSAFPLSLERARAIARALGKPMFAGATAVKLLDALPASFSARASQVSQKLEAAFENEFRGFLVYDYVPAWSTPTFDFDTRPEEPLAGPQGVLAQYAVRH